MRPAKRLLRSAIARIQRTCKRSIRVSYTPPVRFALLHQRRGVAKQRGLKLSPRSTQGERKMLGFVLGTLCLIGLIKVARGRRFGWGGGCGGGYGGGCGHHGGWRGHGWHG